jgi:hypothetical protein
MEHGPELPARQRPAVVFGCCCATCQIQRLEFQVAQLELRLSYLVARVEDLELDR